MPAPVGFQSLILPNPDAQIEYGSPPEELAAYREAVATRAAGFSVRAIADQAGVSIGIVSIVKRGLGNPSRATLTAIDRAVSQLITETQTSVTGAG